MSMAAFAGGPRDGPGGSRKGGSAQLERMHQPVPKGGSVREVLGHVNDGRAAAAEVKRQAAAAVQNRRWMGVVDDAPRRPVVAAWNPGGRAREGQVPPGRAREGPSREGQVPARGPHLGFRKDYHKMDGVDKVVLDDQVGVRPYRGVDGIRPDQIPVWEMKQPQKPGAWQNKYPLLHAQNGPNGPIPQGRMRIGPDRVGPIAEFKHRRIDLRPHAQGHGKVCAHRVGVFPSWPLPPHDESVFKFDPARPQTVPADPEDRSRAAAPTLNPRRAAAVHRVFMAMDPHATGKVEIREMLSHLRPLAYKKRLDFFGRDGVLVSPDDLDEQLLGLLTSLIQARSKDVRLQNAFMPSGSGAGCRTGRLGSLTGHVKLKELLDIYAALSVHIYDDEYFEEILESTWALDAVARRGDVGRVENGRLEYLDVNANMR